MSANDNNSGCGEPIDKQQELFALALIAIMCLPFLYFMVCFFRWSLK